MSAWVDAVPHAVSLFIVAAVIIFSAQRGVQGASALVFSRVVEIVVGAALALSFAWNAWADYRVDSLPPASHLLAKALYVALVAGLLCYVGVAGDGTPFAVYVVLYVMGGVYALYHTFSLGRLLCGHTALDITCLPEHPLRRWFPRSESVSRLPTLLVNSKC